jgi:hypothetical protein
VKLIYLEDRFEHYLGLVAWIGRNWSSFVDRGLIWIMVLGASVDF